MNRLSPACFDWLTRICRTYIKEESEDVAMEIWLDATKHHIDELSYEIVKRRCFSALRRRSRELEILKSFHPESPQSQSYPADLDSLLAIAHLTQDEFEAIYLRLVKDISVSALPHPSLFSKGLSKLKRAASLVQ